MMTNPSTGMGAATGVAAPLRGRTQPPPPSDRAEISSNRVRMAPRPIATRLSERSPVTAGAIVAIAAYVALSTLLLAAG